MHFITQIINAPKPYGEFAYFMNLLPIFLCLILVCTVIVFCGIISKYEPKHVYIKKSTTIAISIHAGITMLAYALLQYRWVVQQFENDMSLEILWAVVESLFILNMIWSCLAITCSVIKEIKFERERDNNDKSIKK